MFLHLIYNHTPWLSSISWFINRRKDTSNRSTWYGFLEDLKFHISDEMHNAYFTYLNILLYNAQCIKSESPIALLYHLFLTLNCLAFPSNQFLFVHGVDILDPKSFFLASMKKRLFYFLYSNDPEILYSMPISVKLNKNSVTSASSYAAQKYIHLFINE